MRTTAAILLFVASTLAYDVTFPASSGDWTSEGAGVLNWERGSGDPPNFAVVLTNQNTTIMDNHILATLVDGTLGSLTMNPPTEGWPIAPGYQVNLVSDPESPSNILASSSIFAISNDTSSNANSLPLSGTEGTTRITTRTNVNSLPLSSTEGTTQTTATTATTSSKPSNAALPALHVQTGFVGLLAFLTALVA